MNHKGGAIKSSLLAIEKLRGAAGVRAVVDAMPPALRAQIEPVVMAIQWYPVEIAASIHTALRDVHGGGAWDLSHAVGVEASRIDFTGIYRAILRAVNYDSIWDALERAWSSYNSQGTIRWIERRAGSIGGVITGVAGYNPGVWNAVAGRTEGLLLLSGAKGASVTVLENSATHARLEAIWVP